MKIFLFFIFILISFFHLYFCYKEDYLKRCVTKALLMPTLLILVLSISDSFNIFIILALIFGFLGDVFLIFDSKENFFLLGLASFLFGHIFYILPLFQLVNFKKVLMIIPIVIIILFLIALKVYKTLQPYLNNLKLPVIIYISTIITMFALALLSFFSTFNLLTGIILVGALLFTISDTLLSISLFITKFKHHTFFVMATYISAQLLLSVGLTLIL